MNQGYQCEDCGQYMEEPAGTLTFEGYREIVTLAFCRDCYE